MDVDDVLRTLGGEALTERDQTEAGPAPKAVTGCVRERGAGEAGGVGLVDERVDVVVGELAEDYRVHWRPPFVMIYTRYDAYTI